MASRLLLVVDTQVDFVMPAGLLHVGGAERIVVPGIAFLAGLDPAAYGQVLFTHDTHTRERYLGSPENLGDPAKGIPGFPLHCERGTAGWENVFNPGLVALPADRLDKGVFDMWEEPDLPVRRGADGGAVDRESYFRALRDGGTDMVTVIGVAADYCVRHAVAGLLARGFRVEAVAHLTAGIARDMARTAADEFGERVAILP